MGAWALEWEVQGESVGAALEAPTEWLGLGRVQGWPWLPHQPLTYLLLPGAPDARYSLMEPVDGFPVEGGAELGGEGPKKGQELKEGWGSEGDDRLRKGFSRP